MQNGNDILSQLFNSIPPDAGGLPKIASSAVDSLIQDSLRSFDADETSANTTKEATYDEQDYVDDVEGGDELMEDPVAQTPEVKMAHSSPNRDAYLAALTTYLGVDDNTMRKEAARQFLDHQDSLVKVAVAEAQRLTFGGEVMAQAFSDELAKIAMAEAQGVDFDTYLEHNSVGLEDIPVEG